MVDRRVPALWHRSRRLPVHPDGTHPRAHRFVLGHARLYPPGSRPCRRMLVRLAFPFSGSPLRGSLSASAVVDGPLGLGRSGTPANSGGRSSGGFTSPTQSWIVRCSSTSIAARIRSAVVARLPIRNPTFWVHKVTTAPSSEKSTLSTETPSGSRSANVRRTLFSSVGECTHSCYDSRGRASLVASHPSGDRGYSGSPNPPTEPNRNQQQKGDDGKPDHESDSLSRTMLTL
jgi:hypothetical protein